MPNGLADRLTARCLLGLSRRRSAGHTSSAGWRRRVRRTLSSRPSRSGPSTEPAMAFRAELNRLADFALLVAYAEGLEARRALVRGRRCPGA